jgi:hypothetical protein
MTTLQWRRGMTGGYGHMPLGYRPTMTEASKTGTGGATPTSGSSKPEEPDNDSLLPKQGAPLGGFGHATSIEPGTEDKQRERP